MLINLPTNNELCIAVTAVEDSNKGEKLIVLYTPQAGTEEMLKEIIAHSDLPNLWKPDTFLLVESLPLLSGI
ncbi:MAG: hypothetical protein GX640_15480 [Fibrobacter sp.]|nr:hypothetical protein [Fibrobacter sp.]